MIKDYGARAELDSQPYSRQALYMDRKKLLYRLDPIKGYDIYAAVHVSLYTIQFSFVLDSSKEVSNTSVFLHLSTSDICGCQFELFKCCQFYLDKIGQKTNCLNISEVQLQNLLTRSGSYQIFLGKIIQMKLF